MLETLGNLAQGFGARSLLQGEAHPALVFRIHEQKETRPRARTPVGAPKPRMGFSHGGKTRSNPSVGAVLRVSGLSLRVSA